MSVVEWCDTTAQVMVGARVLYYRAPSLLATALNLKAPESVVDFHVGEYGLL